MVFILHKKSGNSHNCVVQVIIGACLVLHQHHPKSFGQRKWDFWARRFVSLSPQLHCFWAVDLSCFCAFCWLSEDLKQITFLWRVGVLWSGSWFFYFVSCSRHGGDSRSVQGLLAEGVLEGKRLKRWNLAKGPSALYFRHESLLFASALLLQWKTKSMPLSCLLFDLNSMSTCTLCALLNFLSQTKRWICDSPKCTEHGFSTGKIENIRLWGLANFRWGVICIQAWRGHQGHASEKLEAYGMLIADNKDFWTYGPRQFWIQHV